MEKRTYTQQDRTDIFSNHITGFLKNKELRDSGANVFKPRVSYGNSYGSQGFGIFVDISYAVYNEDLKRTDQISFNYITPLFKNGDGYSVGDKALKMHQNIIDFVPLSAIKDSVSYIKGVFGDGFEAMFEANRSFAISSPIVKKFKL